MGSTPTLFRQLPTPPNDASGAQGSTATIGSPASTVPDDRGAWIAFSDAREDRRRGLSAAGDEEAARGLGIGQQQAPPVFECRRQGDGFAVARPVAVRGAGDEAGAGESLGLSEQGRIVDAQADGETGAARHFERVAEKAEAGDVGHPVDRLVAREVGADRR